MPHNGMKHSSKAQDHWKNYIPIHTIKAAKFGYAMIVLSVSKLSCWASTALIAGETIIIIAPHVPILLSADDVLVLEKDQMQDYGPCDEASKRLNKRYKAQMTPRAA